MYSQQHTIPMTDDGAGDDNSSGTPWSTQPITTQSRSGGRGFMSKLSQRSCSMRAVASVTSCPPVEEEASHEEALGKNWGSLSNLLGDPHASSPSIPRSPSLPSLHPSKLKNLNVPNGKHNNSHVASTPQHTVSQKKAASTPLQQSGMHGSLNYSKVSQTPQFDMHSKLGLTTPQHNNLLSAKGENLGRFDSTTKTSLQHELLSTSKLHTPQHSSQFSNKLYGYRAPLQPITPRQQPLTTSYLMGSNKTEESNQKNNLIINKENTQKSQVEVKLSPPKQPKQAFTNESKVKQDLLRQMLLDSPDFQPASTPTMRTSPGQPFRRSLFDSTPVKQEQKHQISHEPMQMQTETAPEPQMRQKFAAHDNVRMSMHPNHQTHEAKQVDPVHSATPVPPRQSEHAFKPPARPAEPTSAAEPSRFMDHKFKPPPSRPEQATQDIIMVNGVSYVVGHRLGRGGSSEVFQVTRQGDNNVLAIKCVNLRAVDDIVRAGYLNEITLLKRMQGSPRVVQLIDFELCDSRQVLFVVMEKGARDLASFLKDRARRRDLRIGTVEAFWQDMVEAVAEIHDRGIIHSDLKPANFLLVGEVGFHQLKLIDFGIASSVQSDMTSVIRESAAGTLNYMSPETVKGIQGQQCPVKINYKSDIWSLGCILYNLIYGRTPFQHITNAALKTEAICNSRHVIEFPEQSPILPGDGTVPSVLLCTVRNCLDRDPANRPTAHQLLAVKYCGCDKAVAPNMLDILAQGLASLVKAHPLNKELTARLVVALQEDGQKESIGTTS